MKIQKTNAARLLDREKIAYTLVPYQVDEEHLDAIHVAGQQRAAAYNRLYQRRMLAHRDEKAVSDIYTRVLP